MIQLLIFLIVIGVILWMVNQYIPMSPPIKTVINVVVVLFCALFLLNYFGIMGPGWHNYRFR